MTTRSSVNERVKNQLSTVFPTSSVRNRRLAVVGVYSITIVAATLYIETVYGSPYEFSVTAATPVAIILAALPVLWIPETLNRPSAWLYWGLFLLGAVPACIVTSLAIGVRAVPYLIAIITTMAIVGMTYMIPLPSLNRNILPAWVVWSGIVVFAIGLLTYVQITIGLPYDGNVNIGIYSTREQYRAALAPLSALESRFTQYAVNWLYLVVAPVIMAAGILRRRVLPIVAALFCYATVFLQTGYKTALFAPAAILVLYIVLVLVPRCWAEISALGITAGLAMSTVIHALTGILSPISFFRRMIILPGLLTAQYFDFFSQAAHPFTHFTERIWGFPFGASPYDQTVAFLIGATYYDDPGMHANANLWAEGFGSWGILGMFFFSFILIFGFYCYDAASSGVNRRLAVLATAPLIINLSNSDTISFMITNGFLVLIVFILVIGLVNRGE